MKKMFSLFDLFMWIGFFCIFFIFTLPAFAQEPSVVAEESTFVDIVLPAALTTASTLLVLVVGWLLKLLGAYISAKTNSENMISAFTALEEIVNTTVKDLDQTFKAAAADGQFTPEEKAKIKKKALNAVNKQLPEYITKQMGVAVKDLTSFIDSKVEATVRDLKKPPG